MMYLRINQNKLYKYFNKIIYKFAFLIFIFYFLIIITYIAAHNEPDMFELFLRNKTEYYYIERKNYLRSFDINYNESNLITFEDKLNYLLIHESPEYKSNIVDKIKLSEYSKKVLGKDICIPILKIYDNADEINLNELPSQFVLKCNHGSGWNVFCIDKNQFELQETKNLLNSWMNTNYGILGKEFQYYYIKKKIFASPYFENLIDYKVFCFNGKPKFIGAKIPINITTKEYIYNYYDINWNLTDIEYGRNCYKRDPNFIIEKPKNFNLILNYAEKLSAEFVFVRVDFYEIKGKLYLGELTFTPGNNKIPFKDKSQRIYLGNLLNIKKIKPYLFNN